ncbi:hypothetical protein HY732_04120 [Candidatus Uhrbacteria bacterium]|nr:hypothetical protein [Candidatus Uhrbacteria bacterium]
MPREGFIPKTSTEQMPLSERMAEMGKNVIEFLRGQGLEVALSVPPDMKKPTPAQKEKILRGITTVGAALAGAAMFAASEGSASARVREFSPHAATRPEVAQSAAEGLTYETVDILEHTSVLILKGPAESFPSVLPKVLQKDAPHATTATASESPSAQKHLDSPFILEKEETVQQFVPGLKKIVPYRVATYRTRDGQPLIDNIFVKIPYVLKNGVEPQFSLTTDDDKKLFFGKTEVAYDHPLKKDSPASAGFFAEQSVQYPVSDDGKMSIGMGIAYGTEYGSPGTTVHTPGKAGDDKGYMVAPSLEFTFVPDSLSEFSAKMQPHFSEGTIDIAQRRPLVFLGSWIARSEDQNWHELRIDGGIEINGETFMATPISRAKGRVEYRQAFINPAWALGGTIGPVVEHARLPEIGKDGQNPVHVGIRFGATAQLPEGIKNNPSFGWLRDLLEDKELDIGITAMPGVSGDPTGAKIEFDASLEKAKEKTQ